MIKKSEHECHYRDHPFFPLCHICEHNTNACNRANRFPTDINLYISPSFKPSHDFSPTIILIPMSLPSARVHQHTCTLYHHTRPLIYYESPVYPIIDNRRPPVPVSVNPVQRWRCRLRNKNLFFTKLIRSVRHLRNTCSGNSSNYD